MPNQFQRVAIVNRGEAAMRFIHAAHEFSQEQHTSLHVIALFTESDRNAMFVREADEAFLLGPARLIDPETRLAKSTYLDYDRLEHALVSTRAEAVWVGWGFVAEHAAFSDLCRDMGIVFIGPSGDVMRQLGDKIAAKRLAESADIPVAPWSGGPVETISDALLQAELLGFPLLIKAASGGGGRGIRRIRSNEELRAAFESARAEATKAFGDPTVFLERMVEGSRHVEVQIIADLLGNTWAAGVRDCSVQRRQQKIVEESPSPGLPESDDTALREAAVRICKTARYTSAGTVEFLFRPVTHEYWFMEVNTRLQVEHPVTEATTGLDLVKLQIHIARGGSLEGEPPLTRGHAIEVRLNAEDAESGFAAAPGIIRRFRIAFGPGIRLDTGFAEGDNISSDFDSMIAKLISYGQTRTEALARLRRALHDSVIVVEGGTSNRAFLMELLSRPEIENGLVDIGWLDRLSAKREHVSRKYADVALIQSAINAYETEFSLEQSQFYASAARGRPHVATEIGRTPALRYRGQLYSLKTHRVGLQDYRVEMDGNTVEAHIDRRDQFESWLTVFGRRFHVLSTIQGSSSRLEVDGVSQRVDRDDWGMVHAPAPAVVVSITVKPGDVVFTGDRLAVLEAMKMETQVVAPFSGRVRQVLTMPNVQVDTGTPLIQIEATAREDGFTPADRIALGASRSANVVGGMIPPRCSSSLTELRQLMLGFDLDPATTMRHLADWIQTCPAENDQIQKCEDEILTIFVEICSLFHREPNVSRRASAEEPAAETLFFSYLRLIETKGEGLPPWFVSALQRVLNFYGVRALDSSAPLKETLLWICKSHARMEQHSSAILLILERRLKHTAKTDLQTNESYRTLLDRLSSVTQDIYPAVSDLAREVRYRHFDQPLFERARAQVYDEVEEHLAHLAKGCDPADRLVRIRALIDCPQLLAGLIAGCMLAADTSFRQCMLEVLTRRYYRIRKLEKLSATELDGHSCVTAEYDYEGRRIHVVSVYAEYTEASAAANAVCSLLAAVPVDHDIVVDFYLSKRGKLAEVGSTEAELRPMLNNIEFGRPLRRIVFSVAGVCERQRISHGQYFTYRFSDKGYQEETLYRGVHPMMGKRLHLWRLSNFEVQRLPSVEDVYVLHAVAKDNPKDERMFAAAEVRDVSPIRDEAGHVIRLPHLERMLMEALAALRLYQSRRTPKERLYWNRVFLYVWPPLTLKAQELHSIVHRLLPATEGLGLEQVVVRARIPNPSTGQLRDMVVRISRPAGSGLLITFRPAEKLLPMKPLSAYEQKVIRARQRGLAYPYEIIKMLTPEKVDTRAEFPAGDFIEHDLDSEGRLLPVNRSYGENKANVIVGVVRNFTSRYPEGMERVLLLGDPSRDLGALAEPECRRIIAALDLAEQKHIPVEWFAISAGAKISMESGVENMDWIARVLRRIVEFTQAEGEINLLINGINVGAQPYWNAEATMLMHTKGILVMTPKAAMVLTGKRALDYSGSVSAEDNQGIGGYDRIMGVNGQAQYWARDLNEACHILFRHYDHTYVLPGEQFPRRAATADPIDRDVTDYPHDKNGSEGFATVGEILSDDTNPGRKKPFDIRCVMMAAIDQDHPPLERWAGMRAAETAVVWDAHLGGYPVCLIGIESRSIQRMGFVPADGPDQWYAGTLFPQSSKKVARAINAASNNRPVVVLANLSGFDGSPESMRRLQLEYGAEIGRAVVNFKGPIVFCVISRYHGGAYVVFSRALNEQLEVAALEGTYASVIGGAPAAAVVFAGEVDARTKNDERLQALNQSMLQATAAEKRKLRAEWTELYKQVYSEKLGEMASEFDRVHSVQRALRVGALNCIIPPVALRTYLVDSLERGMRIFKAPTVQVREAA